MPQHPRAPPTLCVSGSVCCVPAPCHLPWACPLPPVPFNSNNGQASAAAAHCLPIPPPLPAASRSPGTGEHQTGHRLTQCPWHSPQPGQGPLTQSLLWGAAPGPSCSAPGQGCRCCWLGLSGSASASTAPALPASCLCWAVPSIPAALAPDVPCPHLVTICSAPRWSPSPCCPFPVGWGPVPRAPLPSAAAHRGHGVGSTCASHGRSHWPGATGLFFYNNFLVHSNFFL